MCTFTYSDNTYVAMSESGGNWYPVVWMMKHKAVNLYRITALLSLFAIFPHAAGASCVEKWFQNDGSSVKEKRCSKHSDGEWIYASRLSGNNRVSATSEDRIYYKQGANVYLINETYENSCQFSTGDPSGAASWLTTPRCWFGNHVTNIVEFYKISSQGDSFHTLYQLYPPHHSDSYELNLYSVDKDHVYHFANIVDGADPETFRLLLPEDDLNDADIKGLAIDKNGIYLNDKKVSNAKWDEMNAIPVDLIKQDKNYKRESPYFIKTSKEYSGLYLFSSEGYAALKGVKTQAMQCYTGSYIYDLFCKVNNKTYHVKPDFSSHEIKLESIKNEKQ